MTTAPETEAAPQHDSLADHLPVGVCSIDREFRVVQWNRTLESWTSQSYESVAGHSLLELFPNLNQPYYRSRFEGVFVNGRPVQFTSALHKHFIPAPSLAGGDSELMVQHTSVSRHGDDPQRAVICVEDVTALHSQSEQQRALHEELEEAAARLTLATRRHGEFVSRMSQELRSPINTIMGYAEFLREQETAPERRAALDGLRRNGESLVMILNDAVDFSRIEGRNMRVERNRFELEPLLHELVSLVKLHASEQGIKFELVYDGKIPTHLESDVTRLRQILLNLLNNAVKYTDEGTVTLRVKSHRTNVGSEIVFEVSDTGIGIAPMRMQQLFEPFRQADANRSPRKKGTGMGLAICERLARMLGGKLTATSREKVGSTFTLTLPTEALSHRSAARGKNTVFACRREESLSGRILLVEDGIDNQRVISFFLENAGADVDVASDGMEALEMIAALEAQGSGYDFILMDMQMPRMDGYQATQTLRQRGFTKPIVAITAQTQEYDDRLCREAGCDDYAAKPVHRKNLVDLVARHLGATPADIVPLNVIMPR